MCRFAFYLGAPVRVSSLVTEPANSIIHQSFHSHEREEPLNGDGFGLGWYVPELSDEPALFKEVTPAWNNPNLAHLARVTRTSCLLAHVRAATPGMAVTRSNCHPFAAGPYAFMHNGHLEGFRRYARRLEAGLSEEAWHRVEGTTDSEHLFSLFTDRVGGVGASAGVERMASALVETIAECERLRVEAGVDGPSLLNLVLSDGRSGAVTRYATSGGRAPSLYLARAGEHRLEDGVSRLTPAAEGEKGAVIVASEPLTDDPIWERVPQDTLLVIDPELGVERRPLEI